MGVKVIAIYMVQLKGNLVHTSIAHAFFSCHIRPCMCTGICAHQGTTVTGHDTGSTVLHVLRFVYSTLVHVCIYCFS